MSKVIIETYRGFEIRFNTETESFTAWNDFYDTEFSKKDYSAITRGIDKYIKCNVKFEAFEVVQLSAYGGEPAFIGESIKITGIRKDGKLTYKDNDGKTRQLDNYSAKSYYLSFPELPAAIKMYNYLNKEKEAALSHFHEKVAELMAELPTLTNANEAAKGLMKNR
jgi:hypothetical protein|tara:strand:+ start:51 stop:548 length:498 start_codon:yes stop_codon:yes gene_type:complete